MRVHLRERGRCRAGRDRRVVRSRRTVLRRECSFGSRVLEGWEQGQLRRSEV